MRAGGGKGKGAAFEREVCRDLSRFVDPEGTDTLFWRSSMSGGRGTLHLRKGVKNTTQLGDITCVHKDGHWLTEMFYLELKHYHDLSIASSLIKGKGELAKFWRETVNRATECEREPLLIAKQNRMDTLAVFSKTGLVKFQTFGYRPQVILTSTRMSRSASAYVCLYESTFLK